MLTEASLYIYIIDDDVMLTKSLSFLMESLGYKAEVLGSANEFLEAYDPEIISCLILDVRMPYISGIQLQDMLKKKGIEIPIIFISGHGDIPMAINALKKGAYDFLTKPLNNQKLLDSVNGAILGERQRRQEEAQKNKYKDLCKQLTMREKQIIQRILVGKSTKQIAKLLSISPNTVDVHRANIFKKMDVSCITELIILMAEYPVFKGLL